MTTLEFATPVQTLIPQVEEKMRLQSNGYHAELAFALDRLIAAGGKRVRPTVTLLVSAMLGVKEEPAVTLASAVEMLHTATLVHDDLIDGALMRRGDIDAVVVGADRVAANGDVANKIGTYTVAVLAARHGVPFYVAAPLSTIDPHTPTGDEIPIEAQSARLNARL